MSRCGKFILKSAGLYCCAMLVALIFTFALTETANAQRKRPANDSARVTAYDLRRDDTLAAVNFKDSVATAKDSLAAKGDTSAKSRLESSLGIRISKDAITA